MTDFNRSETINDESYPSLGLMLWLNRLLCGYLVPYVFSFCCTVVNAQSTKAPQYYEAEIGGYTAAFNRMPFWMQTNQYGVVPSRTPALTLRTRLYADYDTTRLNNRKVDFGYGLRVVANAAPESRILLPELYAKIRYRALELSVGRRQELFGLVDSTLSSGSYSWSGNAFPVPKIQLAVPVFTEIPFTRGWVSFMGTFAHGYLNPTGFVNHSMLHQKSLYIRVGRASDVVRFYGGFNHQAVWGGKLSDPTLIDNQNIVKNGELPSRFSDYLYVVTGLRMTGPDDQNRLTNFDYTNRIGNHLGSIDVGADIDLVRHNLFLYRQSLYDDGSLFYLTNVSDGLHGIRLRRNDPDAVVRDVLIEYLNTTSQGGSQFVVDSALLRGRDNYFNHSQFRDGWSYRQRGIGTPFITPAFGPNLQWPFGLFTNNNRVRVFHLGLAGSLPTEGWFIFSKRLQYQAKFSMSRNLGTYDAPFNPPRNQFSGIINFLAPLTIWNGLLLNTSVAVDNGQLYVNNIGLYVGVRKVWHNSSAR